MNDDKRRWWLRLAWLFVIAAFVASILGMLTIGIFILPFAFLGLYLVLKWGGDRKSGGGEPDTDESFPHPLDLIIEESVRKLVAIGAAMWTILGIIIAINGLSNVDSKARPYFIAIILFATFDGIAAVVFTLQGKRRRAILALFASITFPTYFVWVFSLIPIALAGFLVLDPFVAQFRDHRRA